MKIRFLFTFFISTIGITCIGCKRDHTNIFTEISRDESYNHWLKDTITVLKKDNNINYHQKTYSINSDSSSLMIKTKIDTLIDNKINIVNSKELRYAISLLQRNHIMPEKKFRLISVTECYYDLPYKNVGLLYDFQIEVVRFYVITNEFKKEYKFMKGNLTDSISISSLPDV